jgi:hypothetical protein
VDSTLVAGCVLTSFTRQAAALAALAAPYRHARLSAIKLAGDSLSPAHFKEDATAVELRAEIGRRFNVLQKAGILELKVVEPESEWHRSTTDFRRPLWP